MNTCSNYIVNNNYLLITSVFWLVFVTAQRINIGYPNTPLKRGKAGKSAIKIKKDDVNFICRYSCLCQYLPPLLLIMELIGSSE